MATAYLPSRADGIRLTLLTRTSLTVGSFNGFLRLTEAWLKPYLNSRRIR